jgi:hypothetical protein
MKLRQFVMDKAVAVVWSVINLVKEIAVEYENR